MKNKSIVEFMKVYLLLIAAFTIISGCTGDDGFYEDDYDILIYTHSEIYPLASIIIPQFEGEYRCTVALEVFPEPEDVVEQLIQEKDEPRADVVLGIDNGSIVWLLHNRITNPYKPSGLDTIDEKLHFDRSYHFVPYCYGYLAFLYDTDVIQNPPENFGKLQDGSWSRHFLISDPRSSTNGLAFLLWSVSMFGELGYGHFWRSIKNNIFFVSPTWDQSYSMFIAQEAPFLLGHTTTVAYLIENKDTYRYSYFIPGEGAYMYTEGVGVIDGSGSLSLAKQFVDYMLSTEVQQYIPQTRWLYPVSERVELPASFKDLEKPESVINDRIGSIFRANRVDRWVNRWAELMLD